MGKIYSMKDPKTTQQLAYRYNVEIEDDGTLELTSLPFKKGTQLDVILIERNKDNFSDLLNAATFDLDFWDNPIDDEEWNAT